MPRLIAFNKPMNVLCQFLGGEGRETLADYVAVPNVYPAGRLDHDSEGLLLLTDDGKLQACIAELKFKLPKTYFVQVEGNIHNDALTTLSIGVALKDGMTAPARAQMIEPPDLWSRALPCALSQERAR